MNGILVDFCRTTVAKIMEDIKIDMKRHSDQSLRKTAIVELRRCSDMYVAFEIQLIKQELLNLAATSFKKNLSFRNNILKMTQETVCLFNKFGHCKFSTRCRQFHLNEICENELCESQNCLKRHPRVCRFYNQYQRCKFGEFCSYLHQTKTKIS